jgi:hypothetical protein
MKLSIRHTFPCTVEQFWESYWDEGLDAEFQRTSTMRRTLLSEVVEDGKRVRHQRFESSVELPAPVAAALGTKTLAYEQITAIDAADSSLSWRVLPPIYKDRIKAEGQMTVRPSTGGCERVVEGVVEVKIALFGGRIESLVVENLQRSEDLSAALRTRWLVARFGGG